jgi:hypothetical protein
METRNSIETFKTLSTAKATRRAALATLATVEQPSELLWDPSPEWRQMATAVDEAADALKEAKKAHLSALEFEADSLYKQAEIASREMDDASGLKRIELSFKSVALEKAATEAYKAFTTYRREEMYDY